jgi:hypothetical protein
VVDADLRSSITMYEDDDADDYNDDLLPSALKSLRPNAVAVLD